MDTVFSLDSLLYEFQPFQISLPAAAYYPELIEMLRLNHLGVTVDAAARLNRSAHNNQN